MFNGHCFPELHGNVEPRLIKSLYLDKDYNLQPVVRRDFGGPAFPIPQVPLPEYILGFNEITIFFLHERLLDFINLIVLPKFKDINIKLQVFRNSTNENEWSNAIRCLYNIFGNKISKLCLHFEDRFLNINHIFPGIIDPSQIKELGIISNGWIRDRDFDIVFDWLMDGQQNGEQKILDIGYSEKWERGHKGIVKRIKEAFISDTVRRNFLLYFDLDQLIDEFVEENEKTGEILRFYQNEELGENGHCHLLIRCPNDEENRWKEEGEKKLKGNVKNETTIVLDLQE